MHHCNKHNMVESKIRNKTIRSQIGGCFCFQTLDLITLLTYWISSLWSWLLWPESESRANSGPTHYEHDIQMLKVYLECHTGFKWLYHLHFLALCCKKLSRTFLGPRPGTQSKYAHVTRPLLASDWSLSPILASDWLTLAKVWSPWHHSLPHLCVSGGDQRLTPNIYTLLFFFLDTTNQTSWWC